MVIYRFALSILVLALFNGCTLMTQPQPRSATFTPPPAYVAQSTENGPYYVEDSYSTSTSKGKGTRAYSAPKDGKYYIVRQGDNVHQIARRYGRSTGEIAAWNGLTPPYTLSVGQRLVVSGGSSAATPTPSAKPSLSALSTRSVGGGGCHTVARGETVYRIAKTYGQSVNEIMQWNGLRSYSLTVGSRLAVSPGASCR